MNIMGTNAAIMDKAASARGDAYWQHNGGHKEEEGQEDVREAPTTTAVLEQAKV